MKKTVLLIILIFLSLFISVYLKDETVSLNTERAKVQIEVSEMETINLSYRDDYLNYLTEGLEQIESHQEFCLQGICLKYNYDNFSFSDHVGFYLNHQTNRFGFYYVNEDTIIPIYLYSLTYNEPYDDGIISSPSSAFISDTSEYEPAYSTSIVENELKEYKGVLLNRLGNVEQLQNIYSVTDQTFVIQEIIYD